MMGSKSSTRGNNSPIFNNQGDVYQQNVIKLRSEVINPYNLKKVIEFLEIEIVDDIDSNHRYDNLSRIKLTDKNIINNLEEDDSNYYSNNIIESSIYFKDIREILSDPRNIKLRRSYNCIKKTINNKITEIKRNKIYFSDILNDIIDRFLNSNDIGILENEEMVSIMIHFMYYMCHIGEKGDINVETR